MFFPELAIFAQEFVAVCTTSLAYAVARDACFSASILPAYGQQALMRAVETLSELASLKSGLQAVGPGALKAKAKNAATARKMNATT